MGVLLMEIPGDHVTLGAQHSKDCAEDGHLLSVKGLSKHFGALKAVDDLSFEVTKGEIFAIIGPNGAGKTTAFNCITGYYPATAGEARFRGQEVLSLNDYEVVGLGVARTFQKIRVFKGITVLENVLVGAHCRTKTGVWEAFLRTPAMKREEEASRQRARELLRFVGIDRYHECLAQQLSHGDQKRLEVARALATEPELLLLDEPVAGMNPNEKGEMMSLIQTIRERGITVLLVEHDMRVVMGISDRMVVLDHGVKIAEGTPEEIQCEDCVIEAYLGRGYRRGSAES
jgi:branched-chain amino acid transport system ATP-binding protein